MIAIMLRALIYDAQFRSILQKNEPEIWMKMGGHLPMLHGDSQDSTLLVARNLTGSNVGRLSTRLMAHGGYDTIFCGGLCFGGL